MSWRGGAERRGDPAAAIGAYERLLVKRLEAFGPDDHHNLAIRHSIANWRSAAGDVQGAVVGLEELLPDVSRTPGSEHFFTPAVRRDLAESRGLAGDVSGAIAAYRELLADRQRELGEWHGRQELEELREAIARWTAVAGE